MFKEAVLFFFFFFLLNNMLIRLDFDVEMC